MSNRLSYLVCAGALLAACSPAPTPAPAASPAATPVAAASTASAPLCAPAQSREIGFTAPDAKDVFSIEAIGANCAEASMHFSIHKADGKLVWSFAVPVTHTWALIPDDDKPPVAEKLVPTYMAEILKLLEVRKTSDAPDWPKGATQPKDPGGLDYTPNDTRDFYLETRAKGLPMFCFEPTMGIGRCVAYHPDDSYADAYYEMHS